MNENEEPTYEELKESNRVLSNIIVNTRERLAEGARGLLAQGWDECMYTVEKNAWLDWAVDEPPTNPYRESDLPDFGAVLAEFEEEGR